MKILLVTLNQVQQGTYWRAYHLGQNLARRGHQVTLVATRRNNRLKLSVTDADGIELVETPDLWHGKLRGYELWNTLRRMIWLRGRNYDIVHGFEARPTVIYPARMVARYNQAPLILDWADWFGRGGSVEERSNPLLKYLLRPIETYFEDHFRTLANGNTVINSTLFQRAQGLGVNLSQLLLLPNGADTQRIQPISKDAARIKIGLPLDARIIGYIGTIFLRDAWLMAEAFDHLQTISQKTRLIIMGNCPIDLGQMVKQPELVQQTGFLKDDKLVEVMACCDLFWLPLTDSPANNGRFPLKLTDYLAAGRPVVATSVGDVVKIMEGGTVGVLTPPSAQGLVEGTISLLTDEVKLQSMGTAARELVEKHYRWDHLTDELIDFYTRIIKRSGKTGG